MSSLSRRSGVHLGTAKGRVAQSLEERLVGSFACARERDQTARALRRGLGSRRQATGGGLSGVKRSLEVRRTRKQLLQRPSERR